MKTDLLSPTSLLNISVILATAAIAHVLEVSSEHAALGAAGAAIAAEALRTIYRAARPRR